MTLPPVLANVRKRPEMYLPFVTYEGVVSFVLGYDAAVNGGLLWAFREWLVTKLSGGNNLSWPALVLRDIGREDASVSGKALQTAEDHRAAIESLFDTIETFLDERDQPAGARRIYAAYEQWLQHQDWYGPSSPDWLSRET